MKIVADNEAGEYIALNIIKEIEAKRQSKVFCLYHDQRREVDDGVDGRSVNLARKMFREVGRVKKLTVLVESPGGSADDAYRLLKVFRRYCDELEVLVVSWSKSAATFLCLGADKIFMSDDAELGPLDVQIRDPKGGQRISALNAFKSLEFLREHLIETYDSMVRFNVEFYGMDLTHGISNAAPVITNMVNPLFGQVDLMELGQARRGLAVGEEYSRRVMERYSYTNKSEEAINKIVRQLVWEYPSHGFVIDIEEVKKLGLNVERLDDECTDLFEKLLATVHSCIGLFTNDNQVLIDKIEAIIQQHQQNQQKQNTTITPDGDSNKEATAEENYEKNGEQITSNGGKTPAPDKSGNSQSGNKKNTRTVNDKRAVDSA